MARNPTQGKWSKLYYKIKSIRQMLNDTKVSLETIIAVAKEAIEIAHSHCDTSNRLAYGQYFEVWDDAMAGTPLNASWAAVVGSFGERCDKLGIALDAKQIVNMEVTHG